VTLTAPANGATYTAPATVALSATASDPESALARVEFYADSALLGTATAPPYSFTWASVPAGTYALRAVAVDAQGATGSSATISITVEAPNEPPTVTLTAPANGASYSAPATIALSATAADPENVLSRVEFYSGTTMLGADTAAPYSFTWSGVPAGTYTVHAVAVDAAGASATSAAATVTIAAAPAPPPTGVAFQASSDHAEAVTRYELRVFSSGADPNTAAPVATSDLGKPTPDANGEITVERGAFFNDLATGSYVAAVAAIGTGGASTSTGVSFIR
jgi:predicted phage tail protein